MNLILKLWEMKIVQIYMNKMMKKKKLTERNGFDENIDNII